MGETHCADQINISENYAIPHSDTEYNVVYYNAMGYVRLQTETRLHYGLSKHLSHFKKLGHLLVLLLEFCHEVE